MAALLFSFQAAVNSLSGNGQPSPIRPSFPRETTPPFGFFFGFKSFGFAADFFEPVDFDLGFVAMPSF